MIANEALLLTAARIILENYIRENKVYLSLKSEEPKIEIKIPKKGRVGGGPYTRIRPHWTQTPKGKKTLSERGKKMWKDNYDKMMRATHGNLKRVK